MKHHGNCIELVEEVYRLGPADFIYTMPKK